jgi:SAM-dependent methyltransferase
MIIHKLISQHLQHRDDETFYYLQARDAIRWIQQSGVKIGSAVDALDLGCGHGLFGTELMKLGCNVSFADEQNGLWPELSKAPFHTINLDQDDIKKLGRYDVVICSNVYEHLARPDKFLDTVHEILKPQGVLYLSWTNWLSPWGGHEFSPFHYLGPRQGPGLYDKIKKTKRKHTPFENLFPTYIGSTLKRIRHSPHLQVLRAAPRYYTEFSFLVRIPLLREFVTWNCALLLGRK